MGRGRLGLAAAVAGPCLILAGCGSSAARNTPDHPGSPSTAAASSSPANPTSSETFSTANPSLSARMICTEDEIQNAIVLSLGLNGHAPKSSQWVRPVYKCTYRLQEGPLRLSVTEFVTDAKALAALKQTRSQYEQDKVPLQTLDNFGVPAFLASDDVVVTVKDNKLLRVDATELPKTVGPLHRTRRDLSYIVASAILRCWSGD